MLCAAAFGRNTFRQWCSSIHTEHAWTTTMKGLQNRVYCWIFFSVVCDILYLSCAPYASGKQWEHKCPSAFFVPSFPCKKSESFFYSHGISRGKFYTTIGLSMIRGNMVPQQANTMIVLVKLTYSQQPLNTMKQPKFILKRVSWNILLFSWVILVCR